MTIQQQLDIYYWMQLTRTFDERMLAHWKQGRGVGGTFSQRGHEAISVGAAYANYMEEDVPFDHVYASFGDDAFARLQRLKQRYDPTNVLRRNQNIPPA